MEDTLERIAKCQFKTKMDKRTGFWQVDLMERYPEPMAHGPEACEPSHSCGSR